MELHIATWDQENQTMSPMSKEETNPSPMSANATPKKEEAYTASKQEEAKPQTHSEEESNYYLTPKSSQPNTPDFKMLINASDMLHSTTITQPSSPINTNALHINAHPIQTPALPVPIHSLEIMSKSTWERDALQV